MRPLNFAILKYLTTVDEACPEDIIEALKGTYGSFRKASKAWSRTRARSPRSSIR